jgi:hypothetical protein
VGSTTVRFLKAAEFTEKNPPSNSCLAVGPEYYLTGGPRQGYTFNSPVFFIFDCQRSLTTVIGQVAWFESSSV